MNSPKKTESVPALIYNYLIMNGEATFKQLERKFKIKNVELILKSLVKSDDIRIYKRQGRNRVCINYDKKPTEFIPRVEEVVRTIKTSQPLSVKDLAWKLNSTPGTISHILKPLINSNLLFYFNKQLVIPEKVDKFFSTIGFY